MEKLINGQKYEVIKQGSATPFAFIPGGTQQICDQETQCYMLVALNHSSPESLRQLVDEQLGVNRQLREELKLTQDELVKKDEQIKILTAQIAQYAQNGTGKKK